VLYGNKEISNEYHVFNHPVFLVLVILGADLAVIFSGPQRSKGFQNKYGSGYERMVQSAGNEKKV
jgi:hypothetical protein